MSELDVCISATSKWPKVHEFSAGYVDPKLCYYCGGYPFDIIHWTI